jgi:hypothetical protein
MGQNRDGRGGVKFLSQGNGSVVGIVLNDDVYKGRYGQFNFPGQAPVCHAGDGYSDPTGVAGDENVASLGQQLDLVYHIIGTQTLLAPTMDFAQGFLVGLDKTAGDGVEYLLGAGLTALNPLALTVGSGNARFLRVKFLVETVANAAECAVGFRKAEAFQAAIDDYDEMAVLNMQGGDINTETILNGGATATVDTGEDMVDGVARSAEVRVTAAGVVTFFVDGVRVGGSFTFDSGEVILPMVHWLQVTGGSDFVWTELQYGELWHVRKDRNFR